MVEMKMVRAWAEAITIYLLQVAMAVPIAMLIVWIFGGFSSG